MIDSRMKKLARSLITYSCSLKEGENILIEAHGVDVEMVAELVKVAYEAGGVPHVWLKDARVQRSLFQGFTEAQLNMMAEREGAFMEKMQAYIGLRGGDNAYEMSDVPQEKNELYQKLFWKRVHGKLRVPHTKWVVLRWPTASMAQMASMSTEKFEDFYFDVCTLDYGKMSVAMDALVELMNRTDKVRITGPGTDLRFSIRDIPAIKCDGKMNIPDGEVYTAPARDSVNGTLAYNTPSIHDGFKFENISFTFKDGKIVEASSNDNERINRILDTDEGARYVGEFAIGVNPFITEPMGDTLFDEKIRGSIHFTPGSSYDDAFNGNKSAVHWDLVLIQTPDWGGGEIYFDDVLIRKDGLFVLEELSCLNPDELA
ncbi:MAG: aminopeptidase [Christensenellales bacterium]|jgi:aminopeptidase